MFLPSQIKEKFDNELKKPAQWPIEEDRWERANIGNMFGVGTLAERGSTEIESFVPAIVQ